MTKILLAEDEKELSRAVRAVLEAKGYEIKAVYNGKAAVEAAQDEVFDLMILDIMMPVMDGIEALKEIREGGNYTPALFLTAKAEIEDRVAGLEAGADDYLVKPFSMAELVARIQSMTRRSREYDRQELVYGEVVLDLKEQELHNKSSVRLAKKESALMAMFMKNPGKALTTEEIFARIWDGEEGDMEIVWVYVSYLRNKLKAIQADITIDGEREGSFVLCPSSGQ